MERRFFVSAPAPEAAGLAAGADRLAEVLGVGVGLVVVLDVVGLTAGLGLDALTEVAGFRDAVEEVVVVPRFSVSVSGFTGVWWAPEVARDVLRAAAASGFFFSSPEPPPTEGVDLCPALADVGAVALLVGFRTEEPIGARVGGLESPPVVVRVVDEVEGFV